MLSHEWRELEVLCERISDLRLRYTAAQRTKNAGLIEGLKDDIARARRHRELLVHHISARLGSAAANHPDRADAADPTTDGIAEDESGSAIPQNLLHD